MKISLVLGDQLSLNVSALDGLDRGTDVVLLTEVMGEATYVRHHPKKIALVFSAMRHFAKRLRKRGVTVRHMGRGTEAVPHGVLLSCDATGNGAAPHGRRRAGGR